MTGTTLDPTKIRFLALEGGGGKGAAYLGAAIALEELGLLPVAPFSQTVIAAGAAPPSTGLQGISGSSAGAITAFLLAIGTTSWDMWQGLQGNEYKVLLESPYPGLVCGATFSDYVPSGGHKSVNFRYSTKGTPSPPSKEALLAGAVWSQIKAFVPPFAQMLMTTIIILAGMKDNEIAKRVVQNSSESGDYLTNLLENAGLFPGFAVQDLLAKKLFARMMLSAAAKAWLTARAAQKNVSVDFNLAKEVTFADLAKWSPIDLVVGGTNLSTSSPAYFSNATTPTFPVISAVRLSMGIPPAFKPVFVDVPAPTRVQAKSAPPDRDHLNYAYRGWWADGGIINNYPLHAFNGDPKEHFYPFQRAALPLNPGVLGFTLNDAALDQFDVPEQSSLPVPSFLKLPDMLMGAMLFSSTDGQIRGQIEQAHTIPLNAYFLETYAFDIDSVLAACTVPEARARVYKRLGKTAPRSTTNATYRIIVKNTNADSGKLMGKLWPPILSAVTNYVKGTPDENNAQRIAVKALKSYGKKVALNFIDPDKAADDWDMM